MRELFLEFVGYLVVGRQTRQLKIDRMAQLWAARVLGAVVVGTEVFTIKGQSWQAKF